MIQSPEDLLVGIVALALVPVIGWTILRGMRGGRLPMGRTYVHREERRSVFTLLLALYGLALVAVAAISADLLLGLGLRSAS